MEQFILSFRKDISLIEQPEGEQVILQSPDCKLTFKQVTSGLRTALNLLFTKGATAQQLIDLVQESDRIVGKLKFYYHLQKFSELGWLCHSVFIDHIPLAIAIPIASDDQFPARDVETQCQYVMSRFAYSHQVEEQTVLESPLSQAKVILPNWRSAALVAKLAKPQNCHNLATEIPGITEEIAQQFVSLLLNTQMLSKVQQNGTLEEAENITLAQWEFHDLLFHTRSRKGRHNNPAGGTYRFLGKIETLPAVKPRMSADSIDLYKPDIETLKAVDIPFTSVLEQRTSIRNYGETSLNAQQLGEFLYRSARVRTIIKMEPAEISSRPYPCGGAIYELEIYLVVNICEDIPSGLYHYAPEAHQLSWLSSKNDYVEELLKGASQSTGSPDAPQVLMIIAARFQRLAWKYESIAYATMLKHLGVLYQTMYLVATAMDLAPCALGYGDSDLFAKAVGTNYYAETSIGEFILGSKDPNYRES